ncbi:HYR domain-containing protein [Meiothermus cerbereus]|uniref:HYR domain-containing protein n=1 Tax=Meiothermus cerbereus TaxID=65552 RepID=UPI003EF07D04
MDWKLAVQRLGLLVGAVGIFVACNSQPALEPGPTEIIITEGISAPAPALRTPGVHPLSDLAASASLGGSSTTPVSLNGQNCTTFPDETVTITYTITGRQNNPASFQVYTLWTYNGTAWAGSVPVTVNVPARAATDPATARAVTVTLRNTSGGGTGTSSFTIVPFNVITSAPAALNTSAGNATIYVAFSTCAAPNTPPSLTLPADITAEATSSAGAVVNYVVTATDQQDGDLSSAVVCNPASGSTFPLGQTTVNCSVTDSGGLLASGSFKVNVQDTTPPVFSGVPTGQVNLIAANIHGAVLDIAGLGISATDVNNVSPPVSIQCTPANGSTLAIGSLTTVSCTATDSSAYPSPNTSAPVSFNVFVGLNTNGVGFLPPLREAAPFSAHKRGSTIPHKFYPPRYADGTPATDLAAGLRLKLVNTGVPTESYEQSTSDDFSAGSTAWRYDPDSGHYIFNLKTGTNWGTGQYKTTVSYAGVPLAETYFELRR